MRTPRARQREALCGWGSGARLSSRDLAEPLRRGGGGGAHGSSRDLALLNLEDRRAVLYMKFKMPRHYTIHRVSSKLNVLQPQPGVQGSEPRILSRFNHFNSWRWPFSAWHLANLHNKYDDYHDITPSSTDYHCYSNSPDSEWFPPNKFANWRAPPPPDSEWFPPNKFAN